MPKGTKIGCTYSPFVKCEKCDISREFSCEKEQKSFLKRHQKVCKGIVCPASETRDLRLPYQSTIVAVGF